MHFVGRVLSGITLFLAIFAGIAAIVGLLLYFAVDHRFGSSTHDKL